MIKIFTDTSANLTNEILKERNIGLVSLGLLVDGKSVSYNLDNEFDGKAYYQMMKDGADIRTSLINTSKFINAFEPALKDGNDVLFIGMSGGVSGTFSNASIALEELKQSYPQRRVAAFDTYGASLGEGLQVLKAQQMVDDGADFDSILETLRTTRPKMCQFFTVDNIKYLVKTGRVSKTVAVIGNAIHIKPILTGDDTGHIIPIEKALGHKKALKAIADKFKDLCVDLKQTIGIAHADNEDSANLLLEMLRAIGFTGKCLTMMFEPITGSHVGPGTIALFYYGKRKM